MFQLGPISMFRYNPVCVYSPYGKLSWNPHVILVFSHVNTCETHDFHTWQHMFHMGAVVPHEFHMFYACWNLWGNSLHMWNTCFPHVTTLFTIWTMAPHEFHMYFTCWKIWNYSIHMWAYGKTCDSCVFHEWPNSTVTESFVSYVFICWYLDVNHSSHMCVV